MDTCTQADGLRESAVLPLVMRSSALKHDAVVNKDEQDSRKAAQLSLGAEHLE